MNHWFCYCHCSSGAALLRNWKGVIGLQTFLIRFVAILETEQFWRWSVAHSCGWPNDALETLLQCSEPWRRTKTNTDSHFEEDSYQYWKSTTTLVLSWHFQLPISAFLSFSHHRQHTTEDTKVQKGGEQENTIGAVFSNAFSKLTLLFCWIGCYGKVKVQRKVKFLWVKLDVQKIKQRTIQFWQNF